MVMSLKDKTIAGLKWSFIDSFANQGIQFIIGIVLARLLSPREFGLIGIITVFIALSQSFVNSGFSQALIRKNDCTQEDYCTVFYFNMMVGILFYNVLFLSAGPIAKFFKEPQLFLLIRILGINVIIICIGLIQRTILIKRINFRLQAKISIISTAASGILAIWLAYNGWGVWSLVWKVLCQNLITTFFLWIWNRWMPILTFSISSFRKLFDFGSKLLATGLIDTAYRNIYYLVIGKFFSAAELGYYTRADEFSNMPSANLCTIVGRVAYPALATVQDDNQKLKVGFKKLIKSIMLISFVLMIGMAAVAKPMILTLVGEKWLPSVTNLQLLCFVGMLFPLHGLNLDILLIKGRSDLFLRLEIIKKLLAVPVIISGVFFGIKIMITAMFILSCTAYFLNSYWSGRLIDYTMREQVMDILPSFLIALIMGIVVFAIGHFLIFSQIIILSIQIISGALITISIARIIRLDSFMEIKEILLQNLMTIRSKRNI